MANKKSETHRMNESYNDCSRPQLASINSTLSDINEAVCSLNVPQQPLYLIADFGAAHGSNSSYVVKNIIQFLEAHGKISNKDEVLVIHNDLPDNNWPILFHYLNDNKSYYGVANGRSFYELCLPPSSVLLSYSSTAVHWLSHKPCNISHHCSSLFAEGDELKLFREQSHVDWHHFLKQRSLELMIGGLLILVIPGVDEQGRNGFDILRVILFKCAQLLLTQSELLNFTLPIHARSYSDCMDASIFEQCSFDVLKSELKSIPFPFVNECQNGSISPEECIESITSSVRSWSESTLKHCLMENGRSESDISELIEQFWNLYSKKLVENFEQLTNMYSVIIFLILKKI